MSIRDDLADLQSELSEKDDVIKDVIRELNSLNKDDSINDILKVIKDQVDVLEQLSSDLY